MLPDTALARFVMRYGPFFPKKVPLYRKKWYSCFLKKRGKMCIRDRLTEGQYAQRRGISQASVSKQRMKVLRKLRRMMKIESES